MTSSRYDKYPFDREIPQWNESQRESEKEIVGPDAVAKR